MDYARFSGSVVQGEGEDEEEEEEEEEAGQATLQDTLP